MSSADSFKLSRQKSCVACARAKRRCSPQTPQCPRCSSKGIRCVYKNEPLKSRMIHASSPESSSVSPEGCKWDLTIPEYDGPINTKRGFGPLFEGTDSFFDELTINQWLRENAPPPLDITLSLPIDGFGEISYVDRWAADQIVRCFKTYPLMFAKFRFTAFIHARLYDAWLPDSIADVFMVSGIYSSRTKHNECMVFRILEQKTKALLQSDTTDWSLDEHLAAVQALILLYIIQTFDGDIRLRASAEGFISTLETWTAQLKTRLPDLPPNPSWQAWLFAESARRTIIFSLFATGIVSVLRLGYCMNVPKMRGIPITVKASLWNVQSGAAWTAGTGEEAPRMLAYGDFAEQWEQGLIVEELQCVQKLLLTPCLGEKYRDILEIDTDAARLEF